MKKRTTKESFKSKLQKYGLLTTGVFLLPSKMQVNAAIIYTDIPDISISSTNNTTYTPYQDIDGDGNTDFRAAVYFYYYYSSGFQQATVGNESSVSQLALGSIFDASLPATNGNSTIFYTGINTNSTHYMGIKFQISGATHYGWIRYEQFTTNDTGTLIIKDWAYESIPDVGIEVGEIGILPIELILLNAEEQDGTVQLDWATAAELDNKGYQIQRSADGERWESIGFVEGNGTTNDRHDYQFVDETPLFGQSYYRLQQLDIDGTAAYSKVMAIKIRQEKSTLEVFPNPVSGHDFTLSFGLLSKESVQVSITDITGKLISTVTVEGTVGVNEYKPNIGDLTSGVYVAHIQLKDEILARKFVKN